MELGKPHLDEAYNPFTGIAIEFIITFIVTFVYFIQFSNESKKYLVYPLCFAQGLAIMMGYSITSGAANPFRYLGPSLLNLQLGEFYIYLVGGFLGGITAGFVHEILFNEERQKV